MVGRVAVFLDRDGVINRAFVENGKPHPPDSLAKFEILPDVPESFQKLRHAGFVLVVVTNQPDVGDGTQDRGVVDAMHRKMTQTLAPDAIKVCWSRHDPRYKPSPAMLQEAADEFGLDLSRSWMVGDRWRDIDCGAAAGCRTIFIDRGYPESLSQPPDFTCRDLADAAALIVANQRL